MGKVNKEFEIRYTITERYYMTQSNCQRVCVTMKQEDRIMVMEDYPSSAQGGFLISTLRTLHHLLSSISKESYNIRYNANSIVNKRNTGFKTWFFTKFFKLKN